MDTENRIEYSGEVKISSVYDNKTKYLKTFYNNGTPDLFRIICKALCKNPIQEECPTSVDIRRKISDEYVTILAGGSGVMLKSMNYKQDATDNSWSTNYVCYIPMSELPTTLPSSAECRIYLCSSNQKDLAYVDIDTSVIIGGVGTSASLLVEWKLKFNNKTGVTQNG